MAAIKSVALYPEAHPSRKNPRDAVFKTITQWFKRSALVEVALREEVLTINNQPLFDSSAAADELYERVQHAEITTVQFLPGLVEQELGIFLELLANDDDGLGRLIDFAGVLKNAGVDHIIVENEDQDVTGRAVQIYGEATGYMQGLWQETRLGKIPKGDEAVRIVDEMSSILHEDRSPLVGLTMLSDYDNYTFNHSVNVGVFAMALAKEYGYSVSDTKDIGLGGLLHDVGKTQVSIDVINKPGKLDPDEWAQMRLHPVYSGELVQQMGLGHIFDIVQQHHCGVDRQGYPQLPASKELCEGGMMTAVVDVYDSMTTTRPYQRCFTPQEAIAMLFKLRDKGHLHQEFVEAFTRTIGIYPVGTCVRLSNGTVGFVNSVYKGEEEQPIIKIFRSESGVLLDEPDEVDLRDEKKLLIVGTLDPSVYGVTPAAYVDPAPVIG